MSWRSGAIQVSKNFKLKTLQRLLNQVAKTSSIISATRDQLTALLNFLCLGTHCAGFFFSYLYQLSAAGVPSTQVSSACPSS